MSFTGRSSGFAAMARSKGELFPSESGHVAAFAKALSHPARVRIIQVIRTAGELSCGQLVRELPLAQPTVSQHLTALRESGILQGTARGNSVYYRIDDDTLRRNLDAIRDIILETGSADASPFNEIPSNGSLVMKNGT